MYAETNVHIVVFLSEDMLLYTFNRWRDLRTSL